MIESAAVGGRLNGKKKIKMPATTAESDAFNHQFHPVKFGLWQPSFGGFNRASNQQSSI